MDDIQAALSDISRMRDQLAASTRFQGFTPAVVAATGALALALAVFQSTQGNADAAALLMQWVGLAIFCGLLIAADAVLRARRLHQAMAEAMLGATSRQFLPVGVTGAVVALTFLWRAPETSWVLPGLWQMLIALGLFAALNSLPGRMALAAGWYFLCGAVVLTLCSNGYAVDPWMMGIPFGVGQALVAAILFQAGKQVSHGQG